VSSPFEILGVESDADDEEIVDAYRRRVKEAHPDHGGSLREFQTVRSAYEELREGIDFRGEGAGRGEGDDGDDPDGDDESQRPVGARVEYLNYEVLDDHGWELDDDDLFEKASAEGLDAVDYGQIFVDPAESILEAAEHSGFVWPYACRGGACANCAVAVMDGEMSMPVDHILPEEMLERGYRLSCNGTPITEEMQIVYNVKHRPDLEEFRLPPGPFKRAQASD
jgi:ferredoxin